MHPIYCVIYCVNMKGTKIEKEFRNTKKMFYSLDTDYTLWFIFRKMLLKSAVRSVYSQVKSLSRPLNISPRQNFLLHERPAINCMYSYIWLESQSFCDRGTGFRPVGRIKNAKYSSSSVGSCSRGTQGRRKHRDPRILLDLFCILPK